MSLDRRFSLHSYNCWDYAREIWLELTGRDIGSRTPDQITKRTLLQQFEIGVPEFREIPAPVDPCIVLFEQSSAVPHVGIYAKGRVKQLRSSGASNLPLSTARIGYQRVRYFHD